MLYVSTYLRYNNDEFLMLNGQFNAKLIANQMRSEIWTRSKMPFGQKKRACQFWSDRPWVIRLIWRHEAQTYPPPRNLIRYFWPVRSKSAHWCLIDASWIQFHLIWVCFRSQYTFSFSFQYASKELSVLKEGMEELEKSASELAEFFCEDPTSFKIEECFKSLAGFFAKFKKVRNFENSLQTGKADNDSISTRAKR